MPAHTALSRSVSVQAEKTERAVQLGAAGAPDAPVIILSYAHSGAELVQRALADGSGLACTVGTGILPMCEAAALSWARIDNRQDARMSRLAGLSIRALVSAQLTALLAAAGMRRWCELATTGPSAAQAFLQVFPTAKFVCVHRACTDLISATISAHPWSLAGSVPYQFIAGYPANGVAAVAGYWAWATEQLLEFETACPQAAVRVRYEDFAVEPASALRSTRTFLQLPPRGDPQPLGLGQPSEVGDQESPQVPTDMIPSPLGERITHLQSRLGYDNSNPTT
ncbi:MAG: sulfotransferase [Trebonia sp.]